MLLKDIAEELGVEFPVKEESKVRKQPWWWR